MPTSPIEPPTRVPLERDARAVARGRGDDRPRPSSIEELSAAQVMARVRSGLGKPQVLLLYASYCKACRSVMPYFVKLASAYGARGIGFTAASVDSSVDDFASYAPVLGGALEPVWITPDRTTRAELVKLGVPMERDSLYIPLLAVFDRTRRLVAHGNAAQVRELGATLDKLL